MGNSEAKPETSRLATNPTTPPLDPISSMQGKVLASKERLFMEHCSTHRTSVTSHSPWDDCCSDLYDQFLMQRNTPKASYRVLDKVNARRPAETAREHGSPLEAHANPKYVIPNRNQTETLHKDKHQRYRSREKASAKRNSNKPGECSIKRALFPTELLQEELKNRNSLEKEGFKVEEIVEDVKRRLILSNLVPTVRPTETSSALSRPFKPPSFDRVSLLPPNVLFKIISYGIDGFRVYLCVNPSWYCGITEAFNEQFNVVENRFVSTYYEYLSYKDSYTSSSLMKFCETLGTRVDRVIKCEALDSTLGKAVTVAYTYRYISEPTHTYKACFTFDSVRQGGRILWVYLNECSFHGEELTRSQTAGVPPICIGDNLEIAINYYSLRGVVDVDSIQWEPILLEDPPKYGVWNYRAEEARGRERDTSKKLVVDLGRICELEDSEKWRDLRCDRKMIPIAHLEEMQKYFEVEYIEYSDLDISALKITLIAAREGNNNKTKIGEVGYATFGVPVRVVEKSKECTNEVKRVGLIIERHTEVQLRIGDRLIYYHSKTNKQLEQHMIINNPCIPVTLSLLTEACTHLRVNQSLSAAQSPVWPHAEAACWSRPRKSLANTQETVQGGSSEIRRTDLCREQAHEFVQCGHQF